MGSPVSRKRRERGGRGARPASLARPARGGGSRRVASLPQAPLARAADEPHAARAASQRHRQLPMVGASRAGTDRALTCRARCRRTLYPLHGFVQGLAVNMEVENEVAAETGVSDKAWMNERMAAFSKLAASGRYPDFARVLAALGEFDLDFDELFERGIAALLDGLTRR